METIKSSVKHINIEMPKLDYMLLPISIKENGELVQLGENDLMFMTISNSPNSTEYKIQKSIDNGITYNQETGKYDVEFTSEDTKLLAYKVKYGYDITIYYDGNKPKQKIIGTFTITDKYTVNEVVSNG